LASKRFHLIHRHFTALVEVLAGTGGISGVLGVTVEGLEARLVICSEEFMAF